MENTARSRLETVRMAALHLHKVLLEALRLEHEREFGRVDNPAELLRLVAYDARFAWLRPLSRQLVAIDDQLGIHGPDAASVRADIERLLSEPAFEREYLERLQSAPEVVLAHAALRRELLGLPLLAAGA